VQAALERGLLLNARRLDSLRLVPALAVTREVAQPLAIPGAASGAVAAK
jgi:hypothetical protein